MSDFKIARSWLSERESVKASSIVAEADATLAQITISVGGRNVAEFADSKGNLFRSLEIPAYYLAEWIAENWWPLLWEPRKNDGDDDSGSYWSRHSMLSAQHGFALPKVSIEPIGRGIHISCLPRTAQLAGVRFRNDASADYDRQTVELELRSFVDSVLLRLDDCNIHDTFLHDAWTLISETTTDQEQFCRFSGALGISPYDIDNHVADLLTGLQPTLGDRLLMDLCLASPVKAFPVAAKIAAEAAELTKNAKSSTLSPLELISLPADNLSLQAYRRGINAAKRVRQRLQISDTDPNGATRLFDVLKIDTAVKSGDIKTSDDEMLITGAVLREDSKMKVALLQSKESKRRFAAARAIFSAWSSDSLNESRLLTSAVTRDQQANRGFAAEITAPLALIRSKARHKHLSRNEVYDMADDLQIGADVVRHQAINNGMSVASL